MCTKSHFTTKRRLTAMVALLLGVAVIIFGLFYLGPNAYRPYYQLAVLLGEPLDLGITRFEKSAFQERRRSVLICPATVCAVAEKIDLQPPILNVSAQVLFGRLDRIIMAEPDAAAAYLYLPPGDDLRSRYILRSPVLGLPETIDLIVVPIDATHATFALYARDLIRELAPDRSERTARWLAALRADG